MKKKVSIISATTCLRIRVGNRSVGIGVVQLLLGFKCSILIFGFPFGGALR